MCMCVSARRGRLKGHGPVIRLNHLYDSQAADGAALAIELGYGIHVLQQRLRVAAAGARSAGIHSKCAAPWRHLKALQLIPSPAAGTSDLTSSAQAFGVHGTATIMVWSS